MLTSRNHDTSGPKSTVALRSLGLAICQHPEFWQNKCASANHHLSEDRRYYSFIFEGGGVLLVLILLRKSHKFVKHQMRLFSQRVYRMGHSPEAGMITHYLCYSLFLNVCVPPKNLLILVKVFTFSSFQVLSEMQWLKCTHTQSLCVEENPLRVCVQCFCIFSLCGPSLAGSRSQYSNSHYFSLGLQLPPSIWPLRFLYKTELPAIGPRKKKKKFLLTLPTQTNSGNLPGPRLSGTTQAKK